MFEEKKKNARFFISEKNNRIAQISFFFAISSQRAFAKRKKRGGDAFRRHVVWSEDARAEKEDWGARRVGFDREVRRYLFQTHSSEIE